MSAFGSMSRLFWLALGGVALALGVIGVVLPVLPTTPFVILAAFAFGKSSPRLRSALLSNRTFGPMIRDWETHGAIARRYKNMAYGIMILAFLASLVAVVKPVVLIVQAVCMGAAAIYIATRPTTSAS